MKNIKDVYIPIEIYIKDKGEFTDVALLVDDKDFLKEITALRDKYGLNYEFPVKDENKKAAEFAGGLYPGNELYKRFSKDIEKIRKLFFRPTQFVPVIESAVIYGCVSEGVYRRAYLEEQESFDNPINIPDKKYAIIIHAKTRDEDVLTVLQDFRKKVRLNANGSDEERSKYQFGYWADLSLHNITDTHNSIDRLHEWYVKFLKGKKPLDIALEDFQLTKEEYQYLKKKCKKIINPTLEGHNDYDRARRKIDNIMRLRDSIKTQLADYRSIILSANRNIL